MPVPRGYTLDAPVTLPPGYTLDSDTAQAEALKRGPAGIAPPGAPPLPAELGGPNESSYRNLRTGRVTTAPTDTRIPILDAPITGAQQIKRGVETMANPSMEQKAHGLHQVIEGAGNVGLPVLAPAMAAGGIPAAVGLGVGMAAQSGTQAGLRAAGVPEGYAELAGDVVGLGAGGAAGHRTSTALAGKDHIQITPPIKTFLNPVEQAAADYGRATDFPFDAATATGNPAIAGAQKIVQNQPLGVVPAYFTKKAQAEWFQRTGRKLSEQVHPGERVTPELAGTDTAKALNANIGEDQGILNPAYQQFRDIASHPDNLESIPTGTKKVAVLNEQGNPIPGQFREVPTYEQFQLPVDVRALKAEAAPIVEGMDKWMEPAARNASAGYTALKSIVKGNDYLDAIDAEHGLGGLKRLAGATADQSVDPHLRDINQGIGANFAGKLQEAIDNAVGGAMGPGGADALGALQKGRAATYSKYQTAEVLKALRDEPVQAFNQLTMRQDAGIDYLRKVEAEVPGEMPKIGRAFVEHLFDFGAQEGAWNRSQKILRAWQDLGPETKKILFKNPQHIEDLNNFFTLQEMAQRNPNPSGTAVVGSLGTGAGIMWMNPATGTALQLGAGGASKMLFSPKGIKLLTEGLRIPLSDRGAAASIAHRLTVAAGDDAKPVPPAELAPPEPPPIPPEPPPIPPAAAPAVPEPPPIPQAPAAGSAIAAEPAPAAPPELAPIERHLDASTAPEPAPQDSVFRQFHHDAPGAVAKLQAEGGGEAVGALHHPEIGDIDLIWGAAGDPRRNFAGGYGLAHIEAKHPEVLKDLQGIVGKLDVTQRSPNRIHLEDEQHTAKVRLDWDGESRQWLLTAFEKKNPPSTGRTSDVSGTHATGRQTPPSGGGLNPNIAPSGEQVNTDIQAPAAPASTPQGSSPGWIGNIPTSDINVDPVRFQFKANTGQGGAGEELRSVTKYDPEKAGVVSVWKDPADGKTYVVNGHHRVELAQRANHPEMAVRYLDAPNAQVARMKGALINIAEGRGESLDAAKVFRDSKMTPEELAKEGVSLTGKVAREGLALSNLAGPIFQDVVNGTLSPARGSVIGENIKNQGDQVGLYDLLKQREKSGKRLTNDQIGELIRLNNAAPTKTTSTADDAQQSMFGAEEMTRSLLPEKAEVSEYARKQLASERKLFGAVASQGAADRLAEAGNVIKAGENSLVAERANQGITLYDKLSGSMGPIDQILDKAAQRLADGESANDVKQQAYRAIKAELKTHVDRLTGGSKIGSQ